MAAFLHTPLTLPLCTASRHGYRQRVRVRLSRTSSLQAAYTRLRRVVHRRPTSCARCVCRSCLWARASSAVSARRVPRSRVYACVATMLKRCSCFLRTSTRTIYTSASGSLKSTACLCSRSAGPTAALCQVRRRLAPGGAGRARRGGGERAQEGERGQQSGPHRRPALPPAGTARAPGALLKKHASPTLYCTPGICAP